MGGVEIGANGGERVRGCGVAVGCVDMKGVDIGGVGLGASGGSNAMWGRVGGLGPTTLCEPASWSGLSLHMVYIGL